MHHGFHLGQSLRAVAWTKVGDGHMQPVVDARLTVALGQPGFQSLTHGVAAGLQGEVDDGGRSAHGCSDGAGAVIVSRYCAAEGHIEMGVHVDAAGHNEETGRVDYGVAGSGNVGGDLLDRLSVTEDVGFVLAVRVDDGAILDQGGHKAFVFLRRGYAFACTTSAVRSAQVCAGSPLSTRSIVMQPSTGQTSEQRLQPTQ